MSVLNRWCAVVLAAVPLLSSCGRQEPVTASTSIFLAAAAGQVEILKQLSTSQEVDAVDASGYTPLMLAAIGGHADAMRYLVSRGANVNAKHRPSGADLLMLVTASPKGSSEEALSYLLQQGLSPNYSTPSGETALQFATEMKNEVAVARLLDAGAVPTARALQVVDAASYPDAVIRERVRVAASRTLGSR
ncbi:ankyrin repeat domain-containing protein [Rhizobacter sp. Root1238]|uniref:ankyrin repeat domain-containing protein n=1 Tax=Rhizobacter sp. Root1238 TaxID=1736435 RepID=UPI0009E9217B|nr:ankyrin repeat domain-containing protein [Rhizobacter sp. Root1238]